MFGLVNNWTCIQLETRKITVPYLSLHPPGQELSCNDGLLIILFLVVCSWFCCNWFCFIGLHARREGKIVLKGLTPRNVFSVFYPLLHHLTYKNNRCLRVFAPYCARGTKRSKLRKRQKWPMINASYVLSCDSKRFGWRRLTAVCVVCCVNTEVNSAEKSGLARCREIGNENSTSVSGIFTGTRYPTSL